MATVVLPDVTRALYPFKSHFLTLSDGRRMHYVDEGPQDGELLVFVHGYPTWSFLYRALLVYYAASGYRCIAMDHIGYGLSDKPTSRHYHNLRRHISNLTEFFDQLRLREMTLVMEDWGGPFGLGYATVHSSRIKRLVVMNTWVFQDSYPTRLHPLVQFAARPHLGEFLLVTLNLALNVGLQRVMWRQLSPAVLAGYKAPFREVRSRLALVQFPRMLSIAPDHPSAPAMREIEHSLDAVARVPALILWGKENRVFAPGLADYWKAALPRAHGPFHIERSGHYLMEDNPEAVIQHLDRFLKQTV